MVPLKSDVVEAYRVLLGRDPENEDIIRSRQLASASVVELVMSVQQSAEWRARQVYFPAADRHPVDIALLERFRVPVDSRAGHVIDWMGTCYARTLDAQFLHKGDVLEPQALSPRVAALWSTILRCAETAGDHLTVADIGCSWGRWAVIAARAARLRQVGDVQLLLAEPHDDRRAGLMGHLAANGITSAEAQVFDGILAPATGKGWYPHVDREAADMASAIFDPADLRPERPCKEVAAKSLLEFLGDASSTVNLCIVDCPGAGDIVGPAAAELRARVKVLVVSPSSRREEGLLHYGLARHGWSLTLDQPAHIAVGPARPAAVEHGLQIWHAPTP